MRLRQAGWMLGWLVLAVGTARAVEVPSGVRDVRVKGQRLSVRADRMPLNELLATLEQRGIAAVGVQGDVSRVIVSDSFEVSDVAQALRRLLSAHSHLLIDRGMPDGKLRVIEVILLGSLALSSTEPVRGRARLVSTGNRPAASADERPRTEAPAETLVYEALSSDSGTDRAAAAEALAYRSPSGTAVAGFADQVLAQQLVDADEQVRARALETLKDTADEVPVDALAQLARDDSSAERRIQALELLAERVEQDARGPLRLALSDSEPAVRKRARELIEEWDLAR